MVNDFRQLGNVMTKVGNRTVDKSYEIYMALYQGLSGTGDPKNIYREFSPDFFDLIVVDECHRGSARVDSAWREILAYFGSAVQIGLTATPKETSDVSNIGYFGEPVHTYSLKQGIQDGFLAPYKVFRIRLDQDVTGYHVQPGKVDKNTTRLFYDPEFDGEPVQAVDYGPGEPLVLKDPADEPYITGPFPDANNGDETDDGGGRTQYRVEGETGCRC